MYRQTEEPDTDKPSCAIDDLSLTRPPTCCLPTRMAVDRSTESGTSKRPGSRWRPCTHQVSGLDSCSSYFQIADPYLLTPTGKVKAIGVSNWSIPYLEDLSKTWKVVPAINQVELHPYNPQHDLKKYCDDKGILLEAYCPLGSTGAPLLKDEQLIKIAEKNKVSVATICISYQVNRGVVVLPKSVTPEREFFLRGMFDRVLGFELIRSPDIPQVSPIISRSSSSMTRT
jgi:hypothetical protein